MKWYELGSFPILKSSGCRVVNFGRLKRTLTEIPCTVQRCGEQEPAANRTPGTAGAAQPGLSWNRGREETEILARACFYSNVREGEAVPVAKFAFCTASTALLPRPAAGTNLAGSPQDCRPRPPTLPGELEKPRMDWGEEGETRTCGKVLGSHGKPASP